MNLRFLLCADCEAHALSFDPEAERTVLCDTCQRLRDLDRVEAPDVDWWRDPVGDLVIRRVSGKEALVV